MLSNFRTYHLALKFYKACEEVYLPRHLKEQLIRASSSVALNLAEGSAKPTKKDQKRFYYIALGSLRESQACLQLGEKHLPKDLSRLADELGACLYRLTRC